MLTKKFTDADIEAYFLRTAEKMKMPPLFRHFKTEYVQSDGFRLHLDVFESEKDNPVVIFIPGTSTYSMCFVELLFKLGNKGYNVIGFDIRGHGRSEGKRGDYTFQEILNDTMAVIHYAAKRFNENITVFGCSQGGIAAFYLAAMEPPFVKSVLCQNVADLCGSGLERLSRYPSLTKHGTPALRAASKIFPRLPVPITFYLDLAKEKLTHFGDFKQFIYQDPLALRSVRLRALASLVSTPLPKPIEEIKIPVMILHGTADLIFPVTYSRKIYQKLNCKKKLQLYKGLHHSMLVENVDEILPDVVDWLNEIHGE